MFFNLIYYYIFVDWENKRSDFQRFKWNTMVFWCFRCNVNPIPYFVEHRLLSLNIYYYVPVFTSPRPLPVACTAAGSASPLPTFRRYGDPGMWTPLNLTCMLWTPLSRGMKRTEYMSWSIDWMKQSSSAPDGDTTWKILITHALVKTINYVSQL